MKINTKFFGEVEIADDKIITFDKGIIGFPELKHFTMLHDEEKGSNVGIRYLQSLEEPGFAMPVMDPLVVHPEYDPEVDDELLTGVGNLTPENILVMVTVTVPADLTKMTVNLQGPFVINVEERKACQIILEGDKYPVKYPVYDILKPERRVSKMLALSRKKNEAIVINNDIEITVLEVKGDQVKIGITAPKEVPIYRKEVYLQIQEANKAAVDAEGMAALKNLLG